MYVFGIKENVFTSLVKVFPKVSINFFMLLKKDNNFSKKYLNIFQIHIKISPFKNSTSPSPSLSQFHTLSSYSISHTTIGHHQAKGNNKLLISKSVSFLIVFHSIKYNVSISAIVKTKIANWWFQAL